MEDHLWRSLLLAARRILGPGESLSWGSTSWCAFTTFSSLQDLCVYWHCGLPSEHELLESYVADGGTWGQPFQYGDLAHIIFPASFRWERVFEGVYSEGTKTQPIGELAEELVRLGVPHRLTDLVLEVKVY